MKKELLLLGIILFILHFIIWLRPGLILGGGEAGLLFQNPQELKYVTEHAWVDKTIGNPTGIAASSYPTLWILAQLNNLGIPNDILQQLFFFAINLSGAIGIYLIVKKNCPDNKYAAIISALFYISNITAMTIVWNRFQYTYMVFYGGIPLILYMHQKALQESSVKYALIEVLLIGCLNFAFASLPLIELTMLVLGAYTAFFIVTRYNKLATYITVIKVSTIISVGTVLINIWWIVPFYAILTSTTYLSQQAYSASGNYSTLETLSNSLGNMSYVLRMMHRDVIFNMREVWGAWYTHPIGIAISYAIPVIALSVVRIKRKPLVINFFLLWTIMVLFLMKGVSSPFGYIFGELFNKVRALEAFRNPFEKFSLLLPLGYAPLVGYGLSFGVSKINNLKIQKRVLAASIFVLIGINAYPMWNRWVFTSNMSPSNNKSVGDYNQIPQYYESFNAWLNADKDAQRVIIVPFGGEGIRQVWKYGYLGVELSMELVHKPAISLSTNVQFLKEVADQIQEVIVHHSESVTDMMYILGTKYIVTRNDVDQKITQYADLNISKLVQENSTLKKSNNFEKLDVYTSNTNSQYNKIYAAKSIVKIPQYQSQLFTEILPYSNYEPGDIFVNQDQIPSIIQNNIIKETILPAEQNNAQERITNNIVTYIPISKPEISTANALLELPHVNILPNSPMYFIVRIKEQLDTKNKKGTDKDFVQLRQTGKRLVEIYKLYGVNEENKVIDKIENEYFASLKDIKYEYIYNFIGVRGELLRHKSVIEELQSKFTRAKESNELTQSLVYINNMFDNGIPTSNHIDIKYTKRQFTIPILTADKYEILVTDPQASSQNNYQQKLLLNNNLLEIPQNTFVNSQFIVQGVNTIRFTDDDSRSINQKELVQRTVVMRNINEKFEKLRTPDIASSQITPAHYKVQVKGATQPFILVFSEAYHPLWQIKINSNIDKQAKHFIANTYANAWYISNTGDYTIDIEFQPDLIRKKLMPVSQVTVIVLSLTILGISIISQTKRKKHHNVE